MIPVKLTTSINFLAPVVSDQVESVEEQQQQQQDTEFPDSPFNQETLFLKPTSENEVMKTI